MRRATPPGNSPRVATDADAEAVVAALAGAFDADPLWTWAFPDQDRRSGQYETWFGLFVESALPNGWVWIAGPDAAVSVWTPPGEQELSEAAEARVEPFLTAELGAHSKPVLETIEQLEAACPQDRDFYYLSFLGTHPAHRGQGVGMNLLAANLAQIDSESMPAYLESSNPANNPRYESHGFRPRAEFSTPGGEQAITTMWREAR
jgi:GNAT superfamily N-acetyltransferase